MERCVRILGNQERCSTQYTDPIAIIPSNNKHTNQLAYWLLLCAEHRRDYLDNQIVDTQTIERTHSMADLGIETFSDEPAPPSAYEVTARNLLETVRPTTTDSVINVAKVYALLDLANAIRNS